MSHVFVREFGGAGVFDVHERAMEDIVVAAAAHDEVFGVAFAVDADGRLGELGESDAEVDIGAGIVGAPPLAALLLDTRWDTSGGRNESCRP